MQTIALSCLLIDGILEIRKAGYSGTGPQELLRQDDLQNNILLSPTVFSSARASSQERIPAR